MTNNTPPQVESSKPVIHHKIMVFSGKGGVGKSTIAINLAYALAMTGKRTGILDADLHGPSVAKMTGTESVRATGSKDGNIVPVRVNENLYALSVAHMMDDHDKALIWRGPMKISVLTEMIQKADWPELDFLIIDCPPGTGDEPLSVVQLSGSMSGAVVVASAQDVAVLDVRKSLDFAAQLQLPILGLVENMSFVLCPHCGEKIDLFKGEGIEQLMMDYEVGEFVQLPFDINIPTTSDTGRPFIYDFGKTETAKLLQGFIDKVIQRLES